MYVESRPLGLLVHIGSTCVAYLTNDLQCTVYYLRVIGLLQPKQKSADANSIYLPVNVLTQPFTCLTVQWGSTILHTLYTHSYTFTIFVRTCIHVHAWAQPEKDLGGLRFRGTCIKFGRIFLQFCSFRPTTAGLSHLQGDGTHKPLNTHKHTHIHVHPGTEAQSHTSVIHAQCLLFVNHLSIFLRTCSQLTVDLPTCYFDIGSRPLTYDRRCAVGLWLPSGSGCI